MSWFSLVWANLFRRPTRTLLTLVSIIIAFLLLVLLRTVADAFSGQISLAGVDRLVVSPKYSIIDMLPIKQKQQVLAIDGVEGVAQTSWFGGIYQNSRNFFPKFPVKPKEWFRIFSEFEVDPAVVDRFDKTRTGAVVAESLMERFKWSVGQVIPIEADIWPKKDGSRDWAFEIVGIYREKPGEVRQDAFLFHADYFDEAVAESQQGIYGWMYVKINDPDLAPDIASQIDALFANSDNPTKTSTEAEYQRQFAKQLGNIGLAMSAILGAVFFTIVLLTANTMVQAFRDRIPELAVMKTLGFSDHVVSMLVLAESIVICLVGGVIGILLGLMVEPGFRNVVVAFTGSFTVSSETIVMALAIAIGLGLIVGLVPAVTARRLAIVDALRKQ